MVHIVLYLQLLRIIVIVYRVGTTVNRAYDASYNQKFVIEILPAGQIRPYRLRYVAGVGDGVAEGPPCSWRN